jgi:hypothetical protein
VKILATLGRVFNPGCAPSYTSFAPPPARAGEARSANAIVTLPGGVPIGAAADSPVWPTTWHPINPVVVFYNPALPAIGRGATTQEVNNE